MAGYQLTSGQMKAIRETVRTVMNQFRGGMRGPTHQQVQRQLTVVLDAALAAAANALTDAETATASVLQRNSSGDLEDAGYNITVVNRSESIALDQYTIGIATWIDGEWRMTSADCSALGSWP